MCLRSWTLLLLWSLSFAQINSLEASYQCGIRKHSFVELVHRGYNVHEGEWPWHVGLFLKTAENAPEYACGGTLLDRKRILTAAHCVVNQDTRYPLPAPSIELHFGQQTLSKITRDVQIRDVSEVHIHPDYSTHRNDIAVLVLRLPVEYTDFVIPICLDRRADRDLRNLEGKRGWIAGWGTTETGVTTDVLRTASMPVVSYLQCFNDDHTLFGNVLDSNVFCAGDRNGTSPGTGDSGGGMYFSEGDRWVLRGIVSFAKADELRDEVDTSKYAVFVNVQRFLGWIKEIVDESEPEVARGPKRISEQECDRFKGLVEKRSNGLCSNSRYPHTVSLVNKNGEATCSGFLVNEHNVLTTAFCTLESSDKAVKVQFDASLHDISHITRHPQFRPEEMHYDLAVVKLKTSVHLSSNTVPACLANNWTENLYDTLVQSGYGGDLDNYKYTRTFIESDDNQVIDREECQRWINHTLPESDIHVRPEKLCVVNGDRLRTRLYGAAGSPLQSGNSRTCMYTVVGVLNFGVEGSKEKPVNITDIDFYTRVAYHLDWIEQIVWKTKNNTKEEESNTSFVRKVVNWFKKLF